MTTVAAPLVSVREYLSTNYDPDVDYIDGELEERNVGEKSHGKIQKALLLRLGLREKELGIFVIQEQRVRVSPIRFRVPDTWDGVLRTTGPEIAVPIAELFD
jgi:hypothetical protein